MFKRPSKEQWSYRKRALDPLARDFAKALRRVGRCEEVAEFKSVYESVIELDLRLSELHSELEREFVDYIPWPAWDLAKSTRAKAVAAVIRTCGPDYDKLCDGKNAEIP